VTPATKIAKLKRLGHPIPSSLLQEHYAYQSESRRQCKKAVKKKDTVWELVYALNPIGYYYHVDTLHKIAWGPRNEL